jgi:hypothetical protein
MWSTAQTIAIGVVVFVLILVAYRLFRSHSSNSDTSRPTQSDFVINSKADDGTAVPPEVAKALQQVVAAKSKALASATVKVHRAYEYVGPTEIRPVAIAKAIAVDAEFSGYSDRFKIWDLDIVDGRTNENFGSDPDVAFLDQQGNFITFDGETVDFTKPIRLLLVYGVPKTTRSIKLSYWGQDLTPKPIDLEADGMALPKRK